MNRPHRFPAGGSSGSALVPRLALLALLACAAGCGGRKPAPTEPPSSNLPPIVTRTFPAPRSTAVPYDTEIWVEFAEPLDSLTVNATNVLLKVDTRRLAASVRYESVARRVRVVPQRPLDLRRTHTVEISPRVHAAGGGAFAETWFWQFTTNSLRHIGPPDPPAGATNVSPVAPLIWTGTETSAGDIVYHVRSGPDSLQVAARSGTPETTNRPHRLLTAPRPPGTLYWTVRAENRSTGETLDSPVWKYEVLPAGTPVDSLIVPIVWRGTLFTTRPSAVQCNPSTQITGTAYISAVRWDLGVAPAGTQLAAVVLRGVTTTAVDVGLSVPTIYATTLPVPASCLIVNPGPPFADEALGPLAIAQSDPGNQLRYDATLFASHAQAALRREGFNGYLLRSARTLTYSTLELKLYYYRLPQTPRAPAARSVVAGRTP